jgi:hypothetical protein
VTTTTTSVKYDEALDREITEAEEKIRPALQSIRPTIFHYQRQGLTSDNSLAPGKKNAFLELVESEVSKHKGKVTFLKLDANKYPGIAAIFERKAPFTVLLHQGDVISDLPGTSEDVTKIKELVQDANNLPDAKSNNVEFVLWAAAMHSYPAWEQLQQLEENGVDLANDRADLLSIMEDFKSVVHHHSIGTVCDGEKKSVMRKQHERRFTDAQISAYVGMVHCAILLQEKVKATEFFSELVVRFPDSVERPYVKSMFERLQRM